MFIKMFYCFYKNRRTNFIQLLYPWILILLYNCFIGVILGAALIPVDYLIPPPVVLHPATDPKLMRAVTPPPPVTPSSLPILNAAAPSMSSSASGLHQQYASYSTKIHSKPISNLSKVTSLTADASSIMGRLARWFGFVNPNNKKPNDSYAAAASVSHTKQAYFYAKPPSLQTTNDDGSIKEACTLCNKYPWMPVFANSINPSGTSIKSGNIVDSNSQHLIHDASWSPQVESNSYNHPDEFTAVASSLKQRAVHFPYHPHPNGVHVGIKQKDGGPVPPQPASFIPKPIPNLSSHSQIAASHSILGTSAINTFGNFKTHYVENAGAHSELRSQATNLPANLISSSDTSFEIIPSHQLTDFISSIEYPASYVQAPTVEVHPITTTMPSNHKPDLVISTTASNIANSDSFSQQMFDNYGKPSSHQLLSSQLKSEPENFVTVHNLADKDSELQATNDDISLIHPVIEGEEEDNYASGSSPSEDNILIGSNIKQMAAPDLSVWNYKNKAITTTTNAIEDSKYLTTTLLPFVGETEKDLETIATTENTQENVVDWQPSEIYTTKHQIQRNRVTPIHLLDSPIQHSQDNFVKPRPFTKNPAELLLHKQHQKHHQLQYSSTMIPAKSSSTSSYSSKDASGHYAGISPPALPGQHFNSKDMSGIKLKLPYATRHRPRPFETNREPTILATLTPFLESWTKTNTHIKELFTPQETVQINVKSEANLKPGSINNNKQLSKILATNLRELLQRESESYQQNNKANNLNNLNNQSKNYYPNHNHNYNHNYNNNHKNVQHLLHHYHHPHHKFSLIDIIKLQKNIDDWTEQEYSSLSHRPSTPTIGGKSKHIPAEYLPTISSNYISSGILSSRRQGKTTKLFEDSTELPISINGLESLLKDRDEIRYKLSAMEEEHYLQDLFKHFPFDNYGQKFYDTKSTATEIKHLPSTTTTIPMTTISAQYLEDDHLRYLSGVKNNYLRAVKLSEEREKPSWNNVQVSISPQTKEKVYVITPQPRSGMMRKHTLRGFVTTTLRNLAEVDNEKNVKKESTEMTRVSPRFVIRPTPGNAKLKPSFHIKGDPNSQVPGKIETNSNSSDRKRMNMNAMMNLHRSFGLRGLSAYIPKEPVEIIDGNSKVLMATTPSFDNDDSSSQSTTLPSFTSNIMDLTKDKDFLSSAISGAPFKSSTTTLKPTPR